MGQNEDCSPGDSTSDVAERLLQRGGGRSVYICDFDEVEGTCSQAHIFVEGSAAHKEQSST